MTSCCKSVPVSGAAGRFDFAARIHQLIDEPRTMFRCKVWIGGAPQAAPNNDIATIRRYERLHGDLTDELKGAAAHTVANVFLQEHHVQDGYHGSELNAL